MFRAIGDAIWWVITIPVRMFRAFLNGVANVQEFLDRRRYHLCAAIVALMMAVVGIELRYTGYADARPGEYEAMAPRVRTDDDGPSQRTLRQAIVDSLKSLKSKVPSLTGSDPEPDLANYEPIETIRRTELSKPVVETRIPVITASQQRSIMPPPPTEKPGLPAPPKQMLILPEPTVVDLAELDEIPPPPMVKQSLVVEQAPTSEPPVVVDLTPATQAPPPPQIVPPPVVEKPDVASLSGKIEFDDDDSDKSGSVFNDR